MIQFKNILLVLIGSSVGGILRYLISVWTAPKSISYPWGTFLVNISGCFLMGIIMGFIQKEEQGSMEMKLLLATGFCGGFTTYSAFAFESVEMIKQGNFSTVITYTIVSVVLGILSVLGGYFMIR
jgi:CrcB protein